MAGRFEKMIRVWALAGLLLSFGANSAFAQVRAGAAYLKLLPGTRQQNLAGSVTAGLDQPYSLYANPAAVGMLRYWQFSTSYNRWIAGLSNASLLMGAQLRPWRGRASDRVNVAAAVSRQWLGEFDATGGSSASIDASDWWASGTVGLPFYLSGHQASFGATARYFRSNLARYQASALTFDFGFLYRSPRFWLKRSRGFRGILSLGLAVNHLGKDLTFVSQATPLPRTWRAGIAANLGKHDGLQIQLLADLNQIRDEDAQWGLGAEFNNFLTLWPSLGKKWSRAFSLRTGYRISDKQNSQIVSKFSIGLSFRIDDYGSSLRAHSGALVRNNSSLRSDAGFLNSSVFRKVYQGTFSWHPTGPEPFRSVESAYHSFESGQPAPKSFWLDERVIFVWRPARDPDLFDDVNYLVVLAGERQLVQDKIAAMTSGDTSAVATGFLRKSLAALQPDSRASVTFLTLPGMTNGHSIGTAADATRSALAKLNGVSASVRTDSGAVVCRLPGGLDPGDYHWGLIAYDGNFHMRSARLNGSEVGRFRIKMRPDLTIDVTHVEMGVAGFSAEVKFMDKNRTISPDDTFQVSIDLVPDAAAHAHLAKRIYDEPRQFQHGFSDSIKVSWQARDLPVLRAEINPPVRKISEMNSAYLNLNGSGVDSVYDNNVDLEVLDWHDLTVTRRASVEPLRLQFEMNNANVTPTTHALELRRMATAFNSSLLQNTIVKINGHSDASGWRNKTDAESRVLNKRFSLERAESVTRFLIDSCGVKQSRIVVEGFGQGRPITGSAGLDARNRRVDIYLVRKGSSTFSPLAVQSAGQTYRHAIIAKNLKGRPAKDVWLTAMTPDSASATIDDFRPRRPDSLFTMADGSRKLMWRIDPLAAGAADSVTFNVTANLNAFGSRMLAFQDTVETAVGIEQERGNDSANSALFVVGRPAIKHRVRRCENLAYLAEHYYGNAAMAEVIREANGLANNHSLVPGTKLDILNSTKSGPPPLSADGDTPPKVSGRDFSGDLREGSTITLSYRFHDDCETEGASIIKWFRIVDGKRVLAKSVTKRPGLDPEYTLSEADACRDLEVEITPITVGNQHGDPLSRRVGLVRHTGRCRTNHDCLCRQEERYITAR